jgi:hypothetical protein
VSILSNVVRQGLFMAIAASVSLVVVFLVAVIAEANGMVWLTGWFAHGNFVLPWGFLTILLYIPFALIDDQRRGSRARQHPQ